MHIAAPSLAPVAKHLALAAAVLFAVAQFVGGSPQRPAVGPVSQALSSASSADRAKVRSVYHALADLIDRDGGKLIATTAMWRAVYSDALRLAAGGSGLVGKYPGLDAAVEKVLSEHYPLDNVPIDGPMAKRIAAGCRAVEQQCE